MAAKDEVINKFNPKSGPDRDEDKIVPEYPFNDVEVSVFGTKVSYHHPKKLDQAHTGCVHADGSFNSNEYRDKDKNTKGFSISQVHHAMNYASGGTSAMAQGHTENKTLGSGSTMSGGESGQQSKGAVMSGTPAQRIQGHGAFATVATGSEDCTYDFSTGDKSIGGKNLFLNPSGDFGLDVGDSFYTTVAKGECGLHVQDGNYDVRSEKKTQHYSKDEMTIISDTKITLKVGQSQIIISPDNIVLKVGDNVGIKIMSDKVRVTKVAHIGTSDLDTDASNGPSPDTFFQAG